MQAVLPSELIRAALIGVLTAGFVCAPQPVVSPRLPTFITQRRGVSKPATLGGWLNLFF